MNWLCGWVNRWKMIAVHLLSLVFFSSGVLFALFLFHSTRNTNIWLCGASPVSWISCELKCVATCLSSSLSKFVSYPKFYWSHSQAIFVRRILSYHIASLCFFGKTKHKSIRTKGAETHTHTHTQRDRQKDEKKQHPPWIEGCVIV